MMAEKSKNNWNPYEEPGSREGVLTERKRELINRTELFRDRLEREGIDWEPESDTFYGVDEETQDELRDEAKSLSQGLEAIGEELTEVVSDLESGDLTYDPYYEETHEVGPPEELHVESTEEPPPDPTGLDDDSRKNEDEWEDEKEVDGIYDYGDPW